MVDIGLAWMLTLVSAYLSDQGKPKLPPTQGPHGMTDLDLYQQICTGDPLGSMAFDAAVAEDPRRIEGLLLQRIIQPFTLALTKVENPHMNVEAIRSAMAHAYLERNHQMRQETGKSITACQLVEANRNAWKMNGEVLRVAWEMNTPEAAVLKQLMADNQGDVKRAFRESTTICDAACQAALSPECAVAWQELKGILENMCDMVDRYVTPSLATEVIDDEMLALPEKSPTEAMGQLEREDLFGALSFDDAMDAYSGEYEEYIVTGHRAPVIGLSQYRRMGGRVFG